MASETPRAELWASQDLPWARGLSGLTIHGATLVPFSHEMAGGAFIQTLPVVFSAQYSQLGAIKLTPLDEECSRHTLTCKLLEGRTVGSHVPQCLYQTTRTTQAASKGQPE